MFLFELFGQQSLNDSQSTEMFDLPAFGRSSVGSVAKVGCLAEGPQRSERAVVSSFFEGKSVIVLCSCEYLPLLQQQLEKKIKTWPVSPLSQNKSQQTQMSFYRKILIVI